MTAACPVADHIGLLGRETDAAGNVLRCARVVKEYNLIELGLCWHPGIITSPRSTKFALEVKDAFRRL